MASSKGGGVTLRIKPVPVVITVIVLALAVGMYAFYGPQFWRWLWTEGRPGLPVVVGVLGGVLLAGISGFVLYDRSGSRSYYDKAKPGEDRVPKLFVWIGLLAAVIGIVLWFVLPYQVNRAYLGSVDKTTSVPDFEERAPFDVANQVAKRNLEDITGNAQNTKSLADVGENGSWNTLVVRRGIGSGYEASQELNVPLYGEVPKSSIDLCSFSTDATLRLDGVLPGNNLNRAILNATGPSTYFTDTDAYSYCDGKTPMVVAPLKAMKGGFTPHWVPAGAAVYNGKTGVLSIVRDTADLPGPVYPASLAEQQRTAYNAGGSYADYLFGRFGYEPTDKDDDDPNKSNATEFSLIRQGSSTVDYVTPLTPVGSSGTVVGLSTVKANTATYGTLNKVTLNRYPSGETRQATSAVVAALKSQYSSLTDWASGMKVFEVVPGRDNTWVASLGQSQSVKYRAVIDDKGEVKLYDTAGRLIGNSDNGSSGGDSDSGSDTPTADSDLDKLTPQQLRDLGRAVLDELERRTEDGK